MAPATERFHAKILIVDDQPSNVRLLEFTLHRAGYRSVMSTTEPRETTSLHLQNRFDLIVLDLQMPQMDGFAVMRELNEIRDTAPVAILVMTADSAQKSLAMKAGATSFLGKPFKLPDLVEHVHKMLETAAASAQPARSAGEEQKSS